VLSRPKGAWGSRSTLAEPPTSGAIATSSRAGTSATASLLSTQPQASNHLERPSIKTFSKLPGVRLERSVRPTARFDSGTSTPALFTCGRPHSSPASGYQHLRLTADFRASKWNLDVFRQGGVPHVQLTCIGHDPDVFHPGLRNLTSGTSQPSLHVGFNQYNRKGLDGAHQWPGRRLAARMTGPRCFSSARGCRSMLAAGHTALDAVRQVQPYPCTTPTRSVVLEPNGAVESGEMASLYRGARCLVLTLASEGFGFADCEPWDAGTLASCRAYGPRRSSLTPQLLSHSGAASERTTGMGCGEVGRGGSPAIDTSKPGCSRPTKLSERERLESHKLARRFA